MGGWVGGRGGVDKNTQGGEIETHWQLDAGLTVRKKFALQTQFVGGHAGCVSSHGGRLPKTRPDCLSRASKNKRPPADSAADGGEALR